MWGLYKSSYKTTSASKRHIESKYPKLPCNGASEKAIIQQIRDRLVAEGSAAGLGSTPWTKTVQAALGRQPGERFTARRYRVLLAEFVVESSSAFQIVEYKSFHCFVTYLNANSPFISRKTVLKDTTDLKDKY
jgi:hypothetical protein